MLFIKPRAGGAIASIASLIAVLALTAAPAGAATDVYPAGGGTFDSDLQGWQVNGASCNLPLICEAFGEHDATAGNPAGSATARTTVILGLVNLIASTVEFESPEFTVSEAGTATLHLDRQFVPSQVAVPEAKYTVTLLDTTAGTDEVVHSETLSAASPTFIGQDAVVDVTAGSTYAIAIEAETQATVEFGLLGGANLRFDNVAVSVETPDPPDPPDDPGDDEGDDEEKGGGNSSTTSTDSSTISSSEELQTSLRRITHETARSNGRRVMIKVACPRRAQQACRITAQGRIRKRIPVTQRRTVRVAKGKSRLVALRVKPRYRDTVAKRKRLLVVQKVRAGKVTATFARSRALIHPG